MNEFHFGRLLDHVHLRVHDLETSRHFYRAVLGALGHDLSGEDEHQAVHHGLAERAASSVVVKPVRL